MKKKRPGTLDNMDWACNAYMKRLRRVHRGKYIEIHAKEVWQMCRMFKMAYGIDENVLLDALIRRNILNPIGSLSYSVRFE